jgi:hypothetical protein
MAPGEAAKQPALNLAEGEYQLPALGCWPSPWRSMTPPR